jgi:[ribosomal protein S5]-alanine N-acetyltransferase
VASVRFPLVTARLLIRPLVLEDSRALHELYSDRDAMRFLTAEVPETLEDSQAWVQGKIELQERDGMSLWAVVEQDGENVVGDAGLQWDEIDGERVVDLGCRIVRRYWNRCYGTEAAAACIRAGFEQLGLTRITAMTDVGNEAARRSLAKLGMTYERDIDAHGRTMALYSAKDDARPAVAARAALDRRRPD